MAGPPGVAGGIEGPELTYRVRASDVVLRGFALGPQQAERATLIFSSSQRIEVTYEIDVIEIIDGREVGGIRYIVRTGGAR